MSEQRQVANGAEAVNATVSNRKRVAKNTVYLAIRQLIVMAITLYTSRIILEALGVVDFGVYNVVAGVTMTFTFISVPLSTSAQRFLNFEMGKGNVERMSQYFNLSLKVFARFALIIIAIGACLGPWLVYKVLVIPPSSHTGAMVVYYSMLFYLASLLIFSVYEGVVIAHEDMKQYAMIYILEAVMKLAVAFCVLVLPDKLATYGVLLALASLVPRIILAVYCHRRYAECRFIRIKDRSMSGELIKFAGWNIYSGLVYIVNEQGLNIVLNLFFGPVVNAARGIAAQVQSAVVNFCNNFFTAVKPQIFKSYSVGDYKEMEALISLSTRTSAYLTWIIGLPIFLRADQLLGIWLTEVPEYAVTFARWVIFYGVAGTFFNPMQTLAQATGDLKKFSMVSLNVYLAAFPVSIILVVLGAPAWSVYPVIVGMRFLSAVVAIPVLHRYVPLTLGWYTLRVLAPIAGVLVISYVLSASIDGIFARTFWGLFLLGMVSVLITMAVSVLIGLSGSERSSILRRLLGKFCKKSAT